MSQVAPANAFLRHGFLRTVRSQRFVVVLVDLFALAALVSIVVFDLFNLLLQVAIFGLHLE